MSGLRVYYVDRAHTNDVSRSSIRAKELRAFFESFAKVEEKRCTAFDSNHWVGVAHLHRRCSLLCSDFRQALGYREMNVRFLEDDRSAPSTRYGCLESLEKRPDSNICTLATPSPSERVKVCPDASSLYFHALPAPASRRTETTKRSIVLLAFSLSSTSVHLDIIGPIRSTPASRCLHRP